MKRRYKTEGIGTVRSIQNLLEKLGIWLLGISAAGIISGLCTLAAPENGKKAVKFAGGLLIALAVLSPIRSLSGFDPAQVLKNYETELSNRISSYTKTNTESSSQILAQQTGECIENRIAELGYKCSAKVHVSTTNGYITPYSVIVSYEELPVTDVLDSIKAFILSQIGIPIDRQLHR